LYSFEIKSSLIIKKKYTFYLSHVIGFATVYGLLANQQPTFKELMWRGFGASE
jgi:hypothetical protein